MKSQMKAQSDLASNLVNYSTQGQTYDNSNNKFSKQYEGAATTSHSVKRTGNIRDQQV